MIRRRRLASPLAALLCAAACAPRLPSGGAPLAAAVEVGGARIRVVAGREDAAAGRLVAEVLGEAIPRAARFGRLTVPVTITVHPSHEALEAAVRGTDYPWLRAWATYSAIELQSPATWSLLGASRPQLVELVAHELAHCAMYQRAATEAGWARAVIPLWFREGLASHAAGQGHRRGSLEALRHHYLARSGAGSGGGAGGGVAGPRLQARLARGRAPEGDPLAAPDLLDQDGADVVYGAAHHAFQFLLERYGEGRPGAILDRMRAGATFARAFREEVGLGEAELLADFRRYVVWEGWRR